MRHELSDKPEHGIVILVLTEEGILCIAPSADVIDNSITAWATGC